MDVGDRIIYWQHHYKCHIPFNSKKLSPGSATFALSLLKVWASSHLSRTQGHSSRPPCHIEVRPKEGRKRMMLMNNKKQLGESIAVISFTTSSLKMSHWDHHFHLLFLMLLFFPLQLENAPSAFCNENRGKGQCGPFLDKGKPALMAHNTCSLFFILVSMATSNT